MSMLMHHDAWVQRAPVAMAMATDVDPEDDVPPIFREIQKESGMEMCTTKQLNNAIGQEREGWKQALENELISFKEKETFRPLSNEERASVKPHEIYPMQIVAGVKPEDSSGVRRKKARGVVCGNFEPDTGEPTYCSNLDIASLRSTLAIGRKKGWSIGALDVSTAFLNANLPVGHKRVVVRPPAVMVRYGLVPPHELWVANKAVYGLRTSPKAWGDYRDEKLRVVEFLSGGVKYKLEQSYADPAVWSILEADADSENFKVHGYLLSYVDDFLMVSESHIIRDLTKEIGKMWKVSVQPTIGNDRPGSLRYLSIDIRVNRRRQTLLSQQAYCEELLEKWGMEKAKGTGSINLEKEYLDDNFINQAVEDESIEEEPKLADIRLAQRMSGGLLWLASRTRPDISYATSRVASLASSRPKQALVFGKKVLRYLASTRLHGLIYEKGDFEGETMVETFSDASHEDIGTQTGVAIYINGMLVDWRSVRQQVVAFSTCEAEVNALAMGECMGEVNALAMGESMGIRCTSVLYGDNLAANQVADSRGTWRTRALTTKVHAIQTRVARGLLELRFIPTKEMRADGLTKCGGVEHAKRMREHFGMGEITTDG